VETFAEHAKARGAVVLATAGLESDRHVPLSTVRRLWASAPAGARSLFDEGADDVVGAWTGLIDFCAGRPVVCCVDDLHYADAASLESLQHLVRLGRTAPVLVVLSRTDHFTLLYSDFSTELLRVRNIQHIRLSRLDRAEMVAMIGRHPDLAASATQHALELGRISGGNPLLLRALIAERRTSASAVPAIGGPYAQAVVTCVRRCSRDGLRLAGAVAVLGDDASPARLAELLDVTSSAAAQGFAALAASGVLNGTTFWHPVGRLAVLDYLSRSELADLHRRAAEMFHHADAPPQLVADHLVASIEDRSAKPEEPWVVEALCAAAEVLLAGDDIKRAVLLLERAHAVCESPLRRGQIKTRLAAVSWRLDPSLSEQHLNDALDTLSAADAPAESMWPLTQLLVAQGRIADAIEIRIRAVTAADADELSTNDVRRGRDIAALPVNAEGAEDSRLTTMIESCQSAAIDANAAELERFLQSITLSGSTLPSVAHAVSALTHFHNPERAVHWSRVLLGEARVREARGWQYAFTSTLAYASLRTGDLRAAEWNAVQALDLVSDRRNCTFVYGSVSTLILARIEMGDLAGAAAEVDQPMPARLFQSIQGLRYLQARGRYLVATNQPHAALEDFFEAGRIMKRWNLDRPSLVPWRLDAAEVLRRLGEMQAADRLVLQQLSTPDVRHPWIRGVTLRLRAATSEPKKRSLLLQQAASELRKAGDRVELARTLAELGEALEAVGDPLAHPTGQQAVNLATECGANALLDDLRQRLPELRSFEPESVVPAESVSALNARLSESERRVAALAALKYTNREISKLLHVTVSTVEQHLTNVYRKLDINGRRNLPVNLGLYAVDTA